jgi:hypothetical protein
MLLPENQAKNDQTALLVNRQYRHSGKQCEIYNIKHECSVNCSLFWQTLSLCDPEIKTLLGREKGNKQKTSTLASAAVLAAAI